MSKKTPESFKGIKDFYPFYLSEHGRVENRILHFYGTTTVLLLVAWAALKWTPVPLYFAPLAGYLPAWIGHFVIEKNRPATFKYPIKSFVCDFKMYADHWRGKLR